ncbi:GerW family sporulation protein [Pseudalkalibacillus caeni]|uniref:Sporulation protein YtfJ n=1 Tax=Exobacillus caeni TaxID=2574798 RepID=A0A5R9F6B6_9BACL|nr:GerW family sporulation protein [Pseudalkalibacillus caeni]TLS39107.1 sporulation protein YtfJ [Pseudalkalibacillus caeni]
MSGHPIEGLMQTAMENLKEMIDVNTIIGDPVETPDGSVILTVSKVGFGFAAGGSEFMFKGKKKDSQDGGSDQGSGQPFGGGSGGGVSITPIAFLIVNADDVKMVHLDNTTHLYEKLLDFAPQAIDKVQQMMGSMKSTNGNNNGNSNEKSRAKPHFKSARRQTSQNDDRNSNKQSLDF